LSAQHDLIRASYAAFNARELDAALAGLHPGVEGPNAIEIDRADAFTRSSASASSRH
jgi:hypothetical protein